MQATMGCLRLLFISGLFSTMVIGAKKYCQLDSLQYRLPKEIQCVHYTIKLLKLPIPHAEHFYWIDININIEIHKKVNSISIFYDNRSKIDESATILFSPSTYPVYFPKEHIYCSPTQILYLVFDTNLLPGNYTLHMLIKNMITDDNEEGFSKTTYLDNFLEKKAIYTTNFLWAARKVFPCCDEPHIKATFTISVRHPREYTVLSNTAILSQSEMKNSAWTRFNTTPTLPTYLVGVIMFEKLTNAYSLPLMTIWTRQEIEIDFYRTNTFAVNCWNYILKTMNLTNKISSMNHVAMPSSSLLTKSYWGLYTYKEEDFSLPFAHNISVTSPQMIKIAQKLAYNMFVSIIGPTWWDDMLLNEGVATFLGLYITNKMYENFRVIDRFVIEIQHEIMSKDILSRVQPVISKVEAPQDIDALFKYNFTRAKATILVRMIYHLMTDEFFEKAIHIYLQEHEFRSAGWKDLLNIMHDITATSDYSVQSFFWFITDAINKWVVTSNYPVLYVRLVPENKLLQIWQKYMYETKENDDEPWWWMPITYTTQSNINFNKRVSMWYRQHVRLWAINVPPDDWVIFNLQQRGYYRVNYDKENWRRLTEYMMSYNFTNIHPINRAQLIDDSYHLMLAGHLNSTVFLEISKYLMNELDPIVWHPIKRIVANMSTFFQFPESATIIKHIKRLATNVLVTIGLKEDNYRGDLRLLVTELSCELGDDTCLLLANDKLVLFLENPHIDRFSEWRNWVLCTGMKRASHTTWIKMANEYSRVKQDPYLESLSCVEDIKILISYIDIILSERLPISKMQRQEAITSIIEKHISKREILMYILQNYDRTLNVTIAPFSLLNTLIMNLYQQIHFDMLHTYIKYTTFSEVGLDDFDFKQDLYLKIINRFTKLQYEKEMFVRLFNITKNEDTSI